MEAPPVPPQLLPGSYPDRAAEAQAIYWTEAAISTCFLVARFYARYTVRAIGLDDWFMLPTTMGMIALSGIITSIANLGGFRHVQHVPLQNASQIVLQNLISQAVTVFAYGTGKFSVGYLILRLLPQSWTWRRRFIWAIILFTLFYNWLQIILTFVQCTPTEAQWNPMIPSQCWSWTRRFVMIYVGGAYNIIVDVILALFPVSFTLKLKVNLAQRVSLCILLGLSLAAAICGIVKLAYVPALASADATWNLYELQIWSGSELFVIIVCGSIPAIKPLWERYILKKRRQRTHGSSSYNYNNSHPKGTPSGNSSNGTSGMFKGGKSWLMDKLGTTHMSQSTTLNSRNDPGGPVYRYEDGSSLPSPPPKPYATHSTGKIHVQTDIEFQNLVRNEEHHEGADHQTL